MFGKEIRVCLRQEDQT